MKKIGLFLGLMAVVFSCSEDRDDNIRLDDYVVTNFNFTHNWDGTELTNADFNTIQYTNANGQQMSIEKLRYLISDITFTKSDGTSIVIEGYNLVDVTSGANMNYTPSVQIPTGTYQNVSFTFGFDNEDNYNNNYPDLNSALWNVPEMLGGGYHYMQLEGKFVDDTSVETGYAYHAIRAVDMSNAPDLTFQDTFINVNLGPVTVSNDITFEIKMNVAEWFKNPNQWDLNVLPNNLMPNFNAQVMINQNGQDVFSLGSVTQ